MTPNLTSTSRHGNQLPATSFCHLDVLNMLPTHGGWHDSVMQPQGIPISSDRLLAEAWQKRNDVVLPGHLVLVGTSFSAAKGSHHISLFY